MARNLKQNKLSQKYLADHDDDAQIAQKRAAYHAGLQEPPGIDRPTEKENNKNVVSYLGSTSRLDSREMRSNAFFSRLGDESATSMLTATEINLDCAPEQLSKQLDKTPASELKVFVRDVLEVPMRVSQVAIRSKRKVAMIFSSSSSPKLLGSVRMGPSVQMAVAAETARKTVTSMQKATRENKRLTAKKSCRGGFLRCQTPALPLL